ncbi:reverse transcriptase domain-containing protein [Tanacetum coccineum]
MPSHIGSYDGKGDPNNFLYLFEGAIRMQKWLMPVACHMFTYTLKDSARIWWNSQKAGNILDYKDLKAKFRSHFSQQKKFMKTHLDVHNIKQREGESTRAFINIYTDDTLQILGLHEEQRISGFIHGLRTQSLVEHLSTDLSSTYKGLMDKTYTWENSHSPFGEKYPWRLRLGRALCSNKNTHISYSKIGIHKIIYYLKQSLCNKWDRGVHSPWSYKISHAQSIGTIFSEYNSQKPKEEEDGPTNKYQGNKENVLSCIDIKEKMVINDKYPEQKITIGRQLPTRIKIRLCDLLKRYIDVFAWTSAHITGVLRVLMIGGKTFNTEHWINVFTHAEPVKQKKRSLALKRNKAIYSQVEELTKAGILREVKYQTWVSIPMVVKKENRKWKLCVDFTNINKACIREPHPLPAGGTYQKLIDKVFSHQMGRNMEVNADDMVIKSDSEEEMMADITKTLERLRAINLKLNSKNAPSE